MRVRVYDQVHNTCFQSELYALFSSGIFEQCLVVQDGFLQLFPRLAKNEQGRYETMVSFIDPELPQNWVYLKEETPAFRGYPWVWADSASLHRLLAGETVSLETTGWPVISSYQEGWRYVTTQAEADTLLDAADNFHDSVLAELHYVSGSCLHADNSMRVSDSIRQVTMVFHSQWCPPLELVFEGVKGLDLRPAGNNACSALFEATLRVRDAAVFFCDGDDEGNETAYSGTKICAYSLRWRFLAPIAQQKYYPHKGV